jgi:hypothetical protein
MALVLACEVTIGAYLFRQVNDVHIEKSWREVVDTCTIRIPQRIRVEKLQTTSIENYINVGDAVKVVLYYQGKTKRTEFEGYVSRLKPNIPFEVECEDSGYLLKKTNLSKSWKDTTLKEVVNYIISETNKKFPEAGLTASLEIPAVNFSQFRLSNVNGAKALQQIKEEYGLMATFRGKELYVGLAYTRNLGDVNYSLAWNVIEHDLTYRNAEDVQLKVRAIGIKKDNTRVEVDVPSKDAEGEQRTIFFYNVTSSSELKRLAEEEMQKYKFTGYEGGLRTFGLPWAEPLMTANLQDPQYGDKRSGRYVIDSVTTDFNAEDGFKRRIELGIKLNTPSA